MVQMGMVLRRPDNFSQTIRQLADVSAKAAAGLEMWASDGGMETPEEAIRRFQLMQQACAYYHGVYCQLEAQARDCLKCPAAAIPLR